MLKVMVIKAVGFDFFGTIVDAEADSKTCILSMCEHLQQCGYEISRDDFMANYRSVALTHRKTRHEDLREVSNFVWVADTLRRMGIETEAFNPSVVSAVEKYFDLWRLTLAPESPMVLERLGEMYEISLVSNFTNSTFLHNSLKKLGIVKYFDHIIISDSVGWRKPHPKIFKHFLKSSKVKACEAVLIGDELEADVKGAKEMGMKAVLLDRSNNTFHRQSINDSFPDHIVRSMIEFEELLLAGKI